MINEGLDVEAGTACFRQAVSAAAVAELGLFDPQPSPLFVAIAPCLKNPAEYLSEEECQIAVKTLLMLAMSGGAPTEGTQDVARALCAQLGVELP
jgi:hypothetical protein